MTGGQIETILRERIIALTPPINGGVYIRGYRPSQNEHTPNKEDIVVAVLTGTAEQIQKGSCVVNVYIPDILAASGTYYKDKQRTDELEAWLDTLHATLSKGNNIMFVQSGMILTLPEEEIHQHFVSLKMDFKLLNDNY